MREDNNNNGFLTKYTPLPTAFATSAASLVGLNIAISFQLLKFTPRYCLDLCCGCLPQLTKRVQVCSVHVILEIQPQLKFTTLNQLSTILQTFICKYTARIIRNDTR